MLSVQSREDGKRYAVKRLSRAYRSKGERRRLLREVQYHEIIPTHPNIVLFNMAWEEDVS